MALSKTFDPLFSRHGGNIPVAFLRALSYQESRHNPNSNAGLPKAQGLLQIVGVVRDSFNKAHGTHYTAAQIVSPDPRSPAVAVNVQMATELLRAIVKAYGKHPSPNMKEDWGNPEFVKLVTTGWNAGYSESGGLGKVARYLEQRGIPVTAENVYRNAGAAGAVAKLAGANRAWVAGVSDLYFAQPDHGGTASSVASLALFLAVGWGTLKLLS